ncbi:13543_t:CDS:2 [Acaulospora morrowiae]|uniref:13543_t:CDS:1 n=1 Tax=Acaulospora morrowiae TaxID=94023 RepID=A0A9N9FES4_9GLOM|nr:13543_t:CDS:2 [Acaulospora morrowiae]
MPDDNIFKRQRISKACDSCRRKKVKCDGFQPVCGNCSSFNQECTYNDTTKKRGPPKGYIDAIETRLHRMEFLLGGLVHSSDPRAQAVLSELMQGDASSTQKLEKHDFVTHRNGTDESVEHVGGSESSNIINSPDTHTTGDGKDSLLIDDLKDVMEILSIDENNQVRYHGRSSGLYLLRKSDRYKNGILSISNANWRHPGEMIASTQNFDLLKRSELMELPSQEISDHLLEIYFTHIHPILPVLYRPRFFDQLKDKEHLPHLLLNSIYSFAARFSNKPELRKYPDDPESAGDIFFDRAKALLDNDYDNARVTTIQALVVLSMREYGAARVTRGWLYAGMASRMAQDLGMHRNSERWHLIKQTHEEREEQKRVFWACFVIDRIPSAHLGRPLAIDEKDVDVDHVTSSPISTSSGSPAPTNASPHAVSHSISRFNSLIKLCEITGKIIQNIYAIRNNLPTTGETVLPILNSSLEVWFKSLPPHLQYDPSSDQSSDTTTLCLHIIYYSTLILLHRPYTASNNSSHSVCTSAANAITEIADTMLRRNQLSHSMNPVVYCVFTAAVIHIYNATQADRLTSEPAKRNLNKSLEVLEFLKRIWPSALRYSDMLEGLMSLKEVQLDATTPGNGSGRNSRKRGNFSSNKYSHGGIDRHGRQERYRAQFSQSASPPNNNSKDNSSPHMVNSSLVNASQSYAPIQTIVNFTGSMSSQPTSTSQHQQFNTFNQSPLHHGLAESAQMFNNTFGFRNVSSISSDADPQNQAVGDTDPYAAPGMVGLWNIPQSANLDDWTTYLQQNVTFSSPPPLPSQPPIIQMPRVPSMPLPQHEMLLHNDGNDVNMFADNHPLVSNVIDSNNKENRESRTETGSNLGYNGRNLTNIGSGGNGGKDKSTVPLTYC